MDLTNFRPDTRATRSPLTRSVWHRDGLAWYDASLPRWWHRCRTQTYGVMNWFTTVHRCPCGAISSDGQVWVERNSRRKKKA